MTSSIEERVMRVIIAMGPMPTDRHGRIQLFQLASPVTGSQCRRTEKSRIIISATQKFGNAAMSTARSVEA